MPSAYDRGISRALSWLGLDDPSEESHLGRNVAMGTAGAAPFLGLIGQQRLRHHPALTEGIDRVTLEQLAQQARTGDVIVSGKSGSPLGPAAGSDMWHAEPVLGRRDGKGISVSGGEVTPKAIRSTKALAPEQASRIEEIASRIERDPRALEEQIATLDERLKTLKQDRVVLLRPKEKLSPAALEELRRTGYGQAIKPYQARRLLASQLRDWFLPKIPGLERLGKQCKGNICATPAATAFEGAHGAPVVAGKSAKNILGTDFLRSKHYAPVAAHMDAAASKSIPRLQQLSHLGTRAALGAGLAGTVYGLSEDPTLAAIPVGALGAPALARKAMGYTSARPLRQLMKADSKRGLRLRNITRRTLPLMAAGGLGAYLATRLGADALED